MALVAKALAVIWLVCFTETSVGFPSLRAAERDSASSALNAIAARSAPQARTDLRLSDVAGDNPVKISSELGGWEIVGDSAADDWTREDTPVHEPAGRKVRRSPRRRPSRNRRLRNRPGDFRRVQGTELKNRTLFNQRSFNFPSSYGDSVVVVPLPFFVKDSKSRKIVSFDTSSLTSSDSSVRLRTASLYVQFLVEDPHQTAAGRRQRRPERARANSNRREVTITPILLRPNENNGRPIILARGKSWGYSGHDSGINRSGRLRSRAIIRRFIFDVTRAGLSRYNDDSNVTEEHENGDLPTVASWRLPNLQMAVICRRRRSIVPCKKYGVTMQGAPYLSMRTAHVDGGDYGVRLR